MDVPDVNILVNAFRTDLPHHALCRQWLESQLSSDSSFGLSSLVASGFVRIVTNRKVFVEPNTNKEALAFVAALFGQPNSVSVNPGDRHWSIFVGLCRDKSVVGNLIPDAYFAAIAIEHGCRWVTLDRDFLIFKDLKPKILE